MDSNKIAFISCVNNMQYYEESIRYIQDLEMPKGYKIETICIQEAASMTQGYNAGMKASDAKYKVYLHQDTFILNRNFIYDILKIFHMDESVGMIGVLGGRDLPSDASCYLSWDTGVTSAYNGQNVIEWKRYQDETQRYVPVKAIDGMIMITQVDIPWREDFLDGWDFYDVSQTIEMSRRGYRTVVPYQKVRWCHHDCGVSKIADYDFYRRKMVREYPEYFKEESIDRDKEEIELAETIAELRKCMISLLEMGGYDECCDIADHIRGLQLEDTQIREMINLMKIYSLEKHIPEMELSGWWALRDWEQLYQCYKQVWFALLRIRFCGDTKGIEELFQTGKVSKTAVDFLRTL